MRAFLRKIREKCFREGKIAAKFVLLPVVFFITLSTQAAGSAIVAEGTGNTDKTRLAQGTPAVVLATAAAFLETAPDDNQFLIEASRKEAEILAELRALQLDIARDEADIAALNIEITKIEAEITAIDSLIVEDTAIYNLNRAVLAEVLAIYQTAGPASRLELLLSSNSISEFLQRLSAIRQLDRDTAALLTELDENLKALEARRAERIALLNEKAEQERYIELRLADKKSTEAVLEASLVALEEDRAAYEQALEELARSWEKAMTVFSSLTGGFSDIIESGYFPPDTLTLEFGIGGITALMREERFQGILDASDKIPKVQFEFLNDKASLYVDEADLFLEGTFVILDGVTLEFRPKNGTQGGLVLSEEQLDDLSRKSALQFRLKPLLDGSTIRSLELSPDLLVLSIRLTLF